MEVNKIDLYEECNKIVEAIPAYYSNDQKMRKFYVEVGKLLAKSTEFFYDRDPKRRKEIYDNYQIIENREVICRNAVYLYCDLAHKLGLSCRVIEMDDVEGIHWALVYENDGKKYLINPIPDFYRVQLGFSTRSFCHAENYFAYSKEIFDSMSDAYLRELDESIEYVKPGGYYTDELLEKFCSELNNRLGRHIVRTSNFYQDYYLTLLDLIRDEKMSLEEKLKEVEKIDPEYHRHKDIIQHTLETEMIQEDMKKIIHALAYQKLVGSYPDFSMERDGADFIGSMDVSHLVSSKKEIMLYKFDYMMHCMPKFTVPLTGYIENKNFMEVLYEYTFHSNEEIECIRRHTVVQDSDGKKEYYLMFSIKDPDDVDSFYCFYNHKNKTFQMPIEPISFMLQNHMKPLKNSSFNDEIANYMDSSLLCNQDYPNYEQGSAKK